MICAPVCVLNFKLERKKEIQKQNEEIKKQKGGSRVMTRNVRMAEHLNICILFLL